MSINRSLVRPSLNPRLRPSGTLPIGTIATPAIGLEFSGREEGVKDAMLKAYGGTTLTEDAVKDGLGWLVRNQKSRGSWSLIGPYHDGSRSRKRTSGHRDGAARVSRRGYTPKASKNDGIPEIVTRGWRLALAQST